MGRESRQARRARERRGQGKGRQGQSPANQRNWAMLAGGAVIIAAILVVIGLVATGAGKGLAGPAPTPTETPGKTIDGLGCDAGMSVNYHQHAHLTIFDKGTQITVPAQVGFNYNHDCLYWVHTHDTSGVIHIESPHPVGPKLKAFFDLWGKPITSQQIGPAKVQPGETVRTYVNQKLYSGNPANIPLRRHTTITIEIGPPFPQPKPFAYGNL